MHRRRDLRPHRDAHVRDDLAGEGPRDRHRACDAAPPQVGLEYLRDPEEGLHLTERAVALAHGDRRRDRRGQFHVGRDLLGVERAFEPAGSAGVELPRHVDRSGRGQVPESVDRKPHPRWQPVGDRQQVGPV